MRSIAGFNSAAVQGSFDSRALNKLGGAIDMASTGYSNDVQYTESTGGTTYSLGQQVYYGVDTNLPIYPLLNDNKVSVFPGTVNRIVPKIEDDFIDASTPPTITVTGEGYICIKLTYVASTFFPRTAEIIFFEGSVTPEDTETEGYYPLSKINSVTVDEVTTYSQIVLSYGNFVCNRLKSGANPAAWYWATITPQPGA
jgi:hypothetical protein